MGSMRKSRLSHYKQDRLTEHFIAGTTARTAARFCGLHRNTAAYYFLRLREIIAYELEAEIKAMFGGEIEVDESYFGVKRKVVPDSIVYSDCWRGYNVLDVSDFHHFRLNHSKLFADRHNHINSIENFWNQAKRHMRKLNGVPKDQFGLYLKECEWRFNNSDPSRQLLVLRQWVKRHLKSLSGSAP